MGRAAGRRNEGSGAASAVSPRAAGLACRGAVPDPLVADLRAADLAGAGFAGAGLAGAGLAGAGFVGAGLAGTRFVGEGFADSEFARAGLAGVDLGAARFAGADFAGADRVVAAGTDAAFASADFAAGFAVVPVVDLRAAGRRLAPVAPPSAESVILPWLLRGARGRLTGSGPGGSISLMVSSLAIRVALGRRGDSWRAC